MKLTQQVSETHAATSSEHSRSLRVEDGRTSQRVLQKASDRAASSSRVKQLQSHASRQCAAPLPTGMPVQLFKGAANTAQAGTIIPVTLDSDFVAKHVAENEAQAISKTNDRIKGNGPQAMKEGKLGNTLAPRATWNSVIDASNLVLPPSDVWGGQWGYDDSEGYEVKLDSVTIDGWEAIGVADSVAATEKNMTRYVGGTWSVKGGTTDDDSDENATADATNVSVNIDHCTQ